MFLNDMLKNSETYPLWEKVQIKPHHGIAIPLSSLRRESGEGIGTFYDLLPLIDWCKEINLDIIQLLPLNDSGFDLSPYNAISSCALDHSYLTLEKLPNIPHILLSKLSELKSLDKEQKLSVNLKRIKLNWLHEYFTANRGEIAKDNSFIKFMQDNTWLLEYSAFRSLKDTFSYKSWKRWPSFWKNFNIKDLNILSFLEEVPYTELSHTLFYAFLQYQCHVQFSKVKEEASKKGILLSGDIPFSLNPDSADVWLHREIFDLKEVAGAPPDLYNKRGQKWGFPLFNWEKLEKSNFWWWKRRVLQGGHYFDILRFDHIVGFFRIWVIPPKRGAKAGKFLPEDENLWNIQGEKILKAIIDSSSALPIAEDLGTIPECTVSTLRKLGIPGTKIIRWTRRWDSDNGFIPPNEYPPLSVTMVSNHDLDPLDLWWKKAKKDAKDYAAFKGWNFSSSLSTANRKEILKDSHQSSSLFHINPLQEYLISFDDLHYPNLQDERINIPGKNLSTNWRYRTRCTLEALCAHKQLADFIKDLIIK